MAVHDTRAGESNQSDLLLFTRLEAGCRSGRNIQAHAVGGVAIEVQGAIDFIEMVVAADLDGAVAGVLHQQFERLAAGVCGNVAGLEEIFARIHGYRTGSCTVTNFVPSGKVASTWTSCSIS